MHQEGVGLVKSNGKSPTLKSRLEYDLTFKFISHTWNETYQNAGSVSNGHTGDDHSAWDLKRHSTEDILLLSSVRVKGRFVDVLGAPHLLFRRPLGFLLVLGKRAALSGVRRGMV